MSKAAYRDQVCGSVFDAASETAKNEVGTVVRMDDGREFVYCSTAVDITAGIVVAAPAASAVTANVMVAAAIGATEVKGVLAGTTVNLYANGYLHLTDDTGQGYTYRIKSNTAAATVDSVGNTVIFTLYEPLKVAIDTSTDFVVRPDLHTLVIVGTATSNPVGVAVVPAAAATDTTTYYFWAQTKGPACVSLANASSVAVGYPVVATASGQIIVDDGVKPRIGYAASAAEDANGFQPVILCI